jgi:protein SCO1
VRAIGYKKIIALGLILSLSIGLSVYVNYQRAARTFERKALTQVTELAQPIPIAEFELIADNGTAFTPQTLRGHWSFLFFGFTHCQSICPTTMHELGQLWYSIEAAKGLPLPQVVMVSVDPERDTPAAMANYTHAFNPAFVGVTGDAKQLSAFAKQLHIAYSEESGDDGTQQKIINHSGALLLVDPSARVRAIFTGPHVAAELLYDFKVITSHSLA